jgi:hypothetical protein
MSQEVEKTNEETFFILYIAIDSASHYDTWFVIAEKLLTQNLIVDDWFLSTSFGRFPRHQRRGNSSSSLAAALHSVQM